MKCYKISKITLINYSKSLYLEQYTEVPCPPSFHVVSKILNNQSSM